MNPYLNVSGIDAPTCALLLGYSPRLFQEWASGQCPIPPSIAAHISAVLGVSTDDLLNPSRQTIDATAIQPPVWFKLRSQQLGSPDCELVLLVRQLGTFYDEIEQLRSRGSSSWKVLFEEIRRGISGQAPPHEQGRQAAQLFRDLRELNHGRSGIGELLRSSLRNLGVLVVESPITDSKIEGCAFHVGASQRPCIFVNNHNTTWFRRNEVILHELAHLIFDLPSEGAALDIFGADPSTEGISEKRADAFAQEASVPKRVLLHVAQKHGLSWHLPLSGRELATIVADVHVEARLIVRAAVEGGLIEKLKGDDLITLPIIDHLKKLSDHALSTEEYIKKVGGESSGSWTGKRYTSIFPRKLLLPVNYVKSVAEAYSERLISMGRAAYLLMISEDLVEERFGAPTPLGTE